MRPRLRWSEEQWSTNVSHCAIFNWVVNQTKGDAGVTPEMIEAMTSSFLSGLLVIVLLVVFNYRIRFFQSRCWVFISLCCQQSQGLFTRPRCHPLGETSEVHTRNDSNVARPHWKGNASTSWIHWRHRWLDHGSGWSRGYVLFSALHQVKSCFMITICQPWRRGCERQSMLWLWPTSVMTTRKQFRTIWGETRLKATGTLPRLLVFILNFFTL